jgi:lipid II:glycine glycyltransferase (peptidoglycan interpeptide bridge formation enzyme)
MDLRQSPQWGNYLKALGWESVYLDSGVAVRIRRLGPLAVLKIQRPEVLDEGVLREILALRKKYRGFLTKIEPLNLITDQEPLLKKYRFRLDNWPLSVSKTIVIGLTPSEEEILARFSKDGRYCLRRAEKNGLTVKSVIPDLTGHRTVPVLIRDPGMGDFYKLFSETSRRGHFWVPSLTELKNKMAAFDQEALIFLAYQNSLPVAGALVLIYDKTAYYLHAGSTLEGQKLEAPYLIVWEIIKKAKELGCTKLDLEGIYDPRFKAATKNWQSFTIFKHKFGGEEIPFPGAFSRYF